jgi:hypothetical protein
MTIKTKNEIIAELKAQHPTLRSGSDETGYSDLSASDYDTTINAWAEDLHLRLVSDAALATAKIEAQAKLAALGLTTDDLKALGLGGN